MRLLFASAAVVLSVGMCGCCKNMAMMDGMKSDDYEYAKVDLNLFPDPPS